MRELALLAVVWGLSGCSDGSFAEDEPGALEAVETTRQPVFANWTAASLTKSHIVGIGYAINTGKRYAWQYTSSTTHGTVCRGTPGSTNICSEAVYEFTAGGADPHTIVAVGIADDTSYNYAWYSDKTVSYGTSDDLVAYHAKQTFALPDSVGAVTFAMSNLIDADNSDNGHWYYYWLVNGILYRSTGDSIDGDRYSKATEVSVSPSDGPIRGIAFGGLQISNGNRLVETFYDSGRLNKSTTSLNLAQ